MPLTLLKYKNVGNALNVIDIVLVRVTKSKYKPIGMAKPCVDCLNRIRSEIRNVYYTDDTGKLNCESASEMRSSHVCIYQERYKFV
jgi:hypothetical protein